jgi:glycosyltransferase involved in cell wall biosynthesis
MHVLFIPKWYPGPRDPQLGDFIRKQAQALSTKARVSVLYVSIDPDLPQKFLQEVRQQEAPWELHCRYRGVPIGNKILRRILNYWHFRKAVARGIQQFEIERGKPDLIHAHVLVRPAFMAWRLSRRYNVPFIISEHSSEYLDGTFGRKSWIFKSWSRFLFSKAASVTVVSLWLGDPLVKMGLVKSYELLPNVVPGLDRTLPAEGDRKHFLIVADLVDHTKNVSGAIRAFTNALKAEPDLKLDIIGDGPDRNMLEQLSKDLRSSERITFHGKLANDKVLDRISLSGALIVNSNIETFSIVTGEALALGRPVIATRCGGPTAFITPENGILIGPKDEAALTTAILAIARKEKVLTPEKIRRTVDDRYSMEAVAGSLMKIYQRVLS